MTIEYLCPYAIPVAGNRYTCQPRQDRQEILKLNYGRKMQAKIEPNCPKDVKRDKMGDIICLIERVNV